MSEPQPRTEAELLELVRSSDLRASPQLHARIDTMIAESSRPGRRRVLGGSPLLRGPAIALGLGGGVILAALVAVLLLVSGGGGSALSLHQAAALTLGGATGAAPAESPSHGSELTAAVQGVHFPYWEERFGWRSTGERTDRLGGRTVTTVFYSGARGERIGYAIVAGTPAPAVSGGTLTWRSGTAYRLQSVAGTNVVSWLRDGRLCVLSGRGLDGATLLRLASWDDRTSRA